MLIVLIDDMGFGQSSAFGGPVHMPTVEACERRIALQRVPYDGALLADPRGPALRPQPPHEQFRLHRGNRDGIPRADRPAPEQCGPVAEILRLNGYGTAHFGKNHETRRGR